MLALLGGHESDMVEIRSGCGSVLVPPALGGRIFCQMDGVLIHRLDREAMICPSPTEYNNLGGNSLWPAPEGGPFAFNYPAEGGDWYVQDGIAKAIPEVVLSGNDLIHVSKRLMLVNRKGVRVDVNYRRMITVPEKMITLEGYTLKWLCYRTEDMFEPNGTYVQQDVLLAPWSLEQFPGTEGIVAFAKVEHTGDMINGDFYGDPSGRITTAPYGFLFRLGGDDRQQIGIKISSHPQLIGALDVPRSLLILRKTQQQPGLYFNIADNEQKSGPFSAADLYSIFNGGNLGFYELETVGAMNVNFGRLDTSVLCSETLILKGPMEELLRYLFEQEGVRLDLSPV